MTKLIKYEANLGTYDAMLHSFVCSLHINLLPYSLLKDGLQL
jgi:hypothetical protein